jgi:tyrosinase
MVVSLGPTSMAMQVHDLPKNPKSDGTGSNPRCLRRGINRNAAMGATTELMYALLTESKDINTFYNTLLGTPPPKNTSYPWGVSFHFSFKSRFQVAFKFGWGKKEIINVIK